jgi:8-amino-7-oxononanoate synthase
MDGDKNRLEELSSLANRFNALLYSDDAHALGVLGEKGLGLNYKAEGVDLSIGTFGKSFGGFGAFVGCSRELRDYLINFASGFIYTTALPPAVIGGLDASLDLIPRMNDERIHLFKLIDLVKSSLKNEYEFADSDSQIIPIIIGDDEKTITLSNYLKENGLWVSAIRPPTVENGASRLRITLTVRHTVEHIEHLIRVLKSWKND